MHASRAIAPVLFSLASLLGAADPVVDAPLQLEATLTYLNISQNISYQSGRANRPPRLDSSCQLQVQLRSPEGQRMVSIANLQVVEALTDAGPWPQSGATPSARERMRSRSSSGSQSASNGQLSTSLQMPVPPAAAKRLVKLTGSAEVVIASGKPRVIELAPLKDVVGKRMQIEGIDGGEVKVMRGDEDGDEPERRITVVWPAGTLDQRIDRIEYRSADGQLIETQGGGSGSGSDRVYRMTYFERRPGDDIAVHIILHGETATRKAVFTIGEALLPAGLAEPAAAGGFDGKVKAKEIEPPAPAKPVEPNF